MRTRILPSLLALSMTLCLAIALASISVPSVVAEASGSTTTPPDPALANQHLTQANAALQSGRYQDALLSFDQALEADPSSWLTYYRRATAQLSLGRTSAALNDLNTLLELNPQFEKAYLQRAKIYVKEGDFEKAKDALHSFNKIRSQSKSAKQSESAEATALQHKLSSAESALKSLHKISQEFDKLQEQAQSVKGKAKAVDSAKVDQCLQLAGDVLKLSPSHLDTRLARARCHTIKGNLEDAMVDWSRAVHLAPSPFLLRRLSTLSYYIVGGNTGGDLQSRDPAGLQNLKACLHSDPDNKSCAKAHRKLRALEKALKKARNFYKSQSYRATLSALKGAKVGGPSLIDEIEAVIAGAHEIEAGDAEPLIPALYPSDPLAQSALIFELNVMYCKAHSELDDFPKAMPFCDKVLAKDPDNTEAVIARAELALKEEKYDEAVRDYTKAFDASGRTDRRIHEKLQTAQKRLKLSQSKDYYKVLGVKRNDDLGTIKKAYRKAARENHPDKGGSEEKMAQINEAWGVLGNQDLRNRYDNGDDPNDPMGGQQGGYGNPFAQGGHPFEMFFQQGGGGGGFPGGGFPGGGFPGGQQFHFKMG